MRDRSWLWDSKGSHCLARAREPKLFIAQYLMPLFFWRTKGSAEEDRPKEITREEQFWTGVPALGSVLLKGFRLTDWFPRSPGVYWSGRAENARRSLWSEEVTDDPELGSYFTPQSKLSLIEVGGIGTIRLRPRKIDGTDCWLATALTGTMCHSGIPLAVPDKLLRSASVNWGESVEIRGRVRFLQDVGLEDVASSVHHAHPLIVVVDELKGAKSDQHPQPIVITPVALFEQTDADPRFFDGRTGYTYVQCAAGSTSELDAAGDWIAKYAARFAGRVITNFDEQRPILAGAPLSYQRLLANTFDRITLKKFAGTIQVGRIETLVQQTGEVHMGHNINVGGAAIINIDSVLNNVTQTVTAAPGLDAAQKVQLEALVQSLTSDLEKLKAIRKEEVEEIARALEKAVAHASKPAKERKSGLLHLSAKGLTDAAQLVSKIAPGVLKTAGLVAKFVTGLSADGGA